MWNVWERECKFYYGAACGPTVWQTTCDYGGPSACVQRSPRLCAQHLSTLGIHGAVPHVVVLNPSQHEICERNFKDAVLLL